MLIGYGPAFKSHLQLRCRYCSLLSLTLLVHLTNRACGQGLTAAELTPLSTVAHTDFHCKELLTPLYFD